MNTLVYLESREGKPLQGSLELLTAGAALGSVTAAVVGDALAAQAAAAYGLPVVLLTADEICPDAQAAALEGLIRQSSPDLVLFSGTQLGKDLAPRLAQRFDAGCVTDATQLAQAEDGVVLVRPAYGGTVLERLRMAGGRPAFATLRSGSYALPAPAAGGSVTQQAAAAAKVRAKVRRAVQEITEMIDLEGADVIVTGGRGMGDAEHFALVEELAALLGGVVGATRPAIEEGWVSRAHQVGQSGKTVAPKLYIACGVSGAMQHISGILGAKIHRGHQQG